MTVFLLAILAVSCINNTPKLYGTWKVASNYYSGTYKIYKENDSIKAKVLYYNDGTTIIRKTDHENYYVFENLKKRDEVYVDAMSGATKANDVKPNIELHLRHFDSLDVTTYISHKPLKEIWTRVKE